MTEQKSVSVLKTVGKICGLLLALYGAVSHDLTTVAYGAFIFFVNTKLGD